MTELVLRLDQKALDALFPEGSEARVELRQYVLQEAAKRYLKGVLSDETKTYLTKLAKDMVGALHTDRLMKEFFERASNYSDYRVLQLSPASPAAEALAAAVEDAFRTRVHGRIDEKVAEIAAEYEAKLDEKVNYYLVNALERAEVRKIHQRVDAAVKETFATLGAKA